MVRVFFENNTKKLKKWLNLTHKKNKFQLNFADKAIGIGELSSYLQFLYVGFANNAIDVYTLEEV